jgi:hypothetical protein
MLLQAVKDGNGQALDRLLESDIDAPPAVLGSALDKAAANGQLRLVARLLDGGARPHDIGTVTMRGIVLEEKKELFRLLTERNVDFSLYIYSSGNSPDSRYIRTLRYMKKDLEHDRLREELAATKAELSALKKEHGIPETPTPSKPAPKDGDGQGMRL